MKRVHRHLALTVAALIAALLAVPVAQGATKYPTVSKVTPLKVGVGDTLTIQGKGFRSGKNKNTVVFRSTKGKTVFAKAGAASSTRIQIVIPPKLMPFMEAGDGTVKPTKFRIRVVSGKLGKKYTSNSKSPTIGPVGTGSKTATGSSANAGSNGDCDGDGIVNSHETDRDNDFINDTTEAAESHTDICDPDTDGDGVMDGYEYRSARDYNALATFYPAKLPYPNPLDGTDANVDFDGDSLTLYEEYMAWTYTGRPTSPSLSYSDGTQNSQGSGITDDRKDVDTDGLDNYNETHGPMSGPAWWNAVYGQSEHNACHAQESAYPGVPYRGSNFVDPDTDGDAVLDGPDDVDHDGYSNAFESYRPSDWCSTYQSTAPAHYDGTNPVARVQPFNPCKPTYSEKCHIHEPVGYYHAGEDWESPYHGTL